MLVIGGVTLITHNNTGTNRFKVTFCCSTIVEVANNGLKGHFFTIAMKSPAELPGQEREETFTSKKLREPLKEKCHTLQLLELQQPTTTIPAQPIPK